MLKAEGFDIGTSTLLDIQKVVASLKDEDVSDISELKSVLGPFICRNKEEQENFHKVFDKYIKSIPSAIDREIITPPETPQKPNYLAAWLMIFFLAAALVFYFFFYHPKPSVDLEIETAAMPQNPFAIINDSVIYKAVPGKYTSRKLTVVLKIDDTVYKNVNPVVKIYNTVGEHRAQAWLLNSKNDTVATSALQRLGIRCEKPPSVSIRKEIKDPAKNPTRKTFIPEFINPTKDSIQYRYKWFIDDRPVSNEKYFTTSYTPETSYKISLFVESAGLHCSTNSLDASLIEYPAYDLAISTSNPFRFTANMNWKAILWVLLLAFVLPLTVAGCILFLNRKKSMKQVEAAVETDIPEEYSGPFKIEFRPQNDKITPEVEIGQMAEAMRKRHVGDNLELNIQRTIRTTIRAGGFPSLIFSPRTEPTDFLIFLDKGNATGHQSQLFEYVLKRLQNEQVNIISYHFYKEPLFLSNEKLNHSMIPVDKIGRLYPNTVLIVFSNTQAFFQTLNRKVKPWVTEKFRVWQRKIIITPVPVNDWDYKEQSLLREGFTVVPADLNAHHLIVGEINDLINKEKALKIPVPETYSSRFINFDEWSELKAYLGNDPLLLQWVCALAVYPYIDWKVTIAIGKAIEGRLAPQSRLVTYSNLLKISRIKWMQTGVQPDELRLEMLHELDKNTEKIARDAMVQLLTEVENEILPSSLVMDEFVMNKTVNRFLLHANNPELNRFTDEEKALMKKYIAKQALDYPLDSYLNSGDETLLKDKRGHKSISPTQFFEADDQERQKQIRRQLMIRRVAAAVAVLIGVFFLFRFFGDPKNYQLKSHFADISLGFFASGSGLDSSTKLSISTGGKMYPATKVSDSNFTIQNLPIDSTQPASIVVQNMRADVSIERPINLKWQAFRVSVVPPAAKRPLYIRYNDATVFNAVQDQLGSELYRYNISASQQEYGDSSKIIYYENNQKPSADSIAAIVKSSLGISVAIEFIEEIRTPPATPILFLNLSLGPCSQVSISTLSSSLNEIWRGQKSNRLATIDLSRQVIYYSTGAKTTYGTYRIDEICLGNSGAYKLITSANNQFKVFFIRNLNAQGFELAACQDFVGTRELAENTKEEECGNYYDNMTVHYERSATSINVPMDARSYSAQARSTLKTAVNRTGSNQVTNITVFINRFFRPSSNDIVSRQNMIRQRAPLTPNEITAANWKNTPFNGTPFDRDYLNIETAKSEVNAPADDSKQGGGPDCSKVFTSIDEGMKEPNRVCRMSLAGLYYTDVPKELYSFRNLQELDLTQNKIPLDQIQQLQKALPKCKISYDIVGGVVVDPDATYTKISDINFSASYYPDKTGEALLERVSKVLKGNTNAKVKLRGVYTSPQDRKTIDAYIQNSINLIVKRGISSIRQIETEFVDGSKNQQQQQQKAPPRTGQKIVIELLGMNFPGNF